MRLTRHVRDQILCQNEGFETSTHFDFKNSTSTRRDRIEGGELRFRETGKRSWADSRYDREYVADDEQTRRFLRQHPGELNTQGVTARTADVEATVNDTSADASRAQPSDAGPLPEGAATDRVVPDEAEPIAGGDAFASRCDPHGHDRTAAAVILGAVVVVVGGVLIAPHVKPFWNGTARLAARRLRDRLMKHRPDDRDEPR